jgi:hypothetical protein
MNRAAMLAAGGTGTNQASTGGTTKGRRGEKAPGRTMFNKLFGSKK